MEDDSKLSINNMVELAMGLSMASLFAKTMNAAHSNTARVLENNQLQAPPKYIHTILNGVQKGPFSIGELMSMIETADVTLDTYMWKPGMAEWKMARDIEDITPTFEFIPPKAPTLK